MAMAIEIQGMNRVVDDIVGSLHVSFGGAVDIETITEAVERELTRYADAPIRDFVPLLVERDVRAHLREQRAG